MHARARCALALAILAIGCSKKPGKRHQATAAEMPPALGGLVVGLATRAELEAKLPGATAEPKMYKEQELTALSWPEPAAITDAYFTADGRLVYVNVLGDDLCDWVAKTVGQKPGAKECPGNRPKGDWGKGSYFCLTPAAGSPGKPDLQYDCAREHYARKPDGTSGYTNELTIRLY